MDTIVKSQYDISIEITLSARRIALLETARENLFEELGRIQDPSSDREEVIKAFWQLEIAFEEAIKAESKYLSSRSLSSPQQSLQHQGRQK